MCWNVQINKYHQHIQHATIVVRNYCVRQMRKRRCLCRQALFFFLFQYLSKDHPENLSIYIERVKLSDHCQQDGYLVPSSRCCFCFEAAFQLWDLNLSLSVYLINAALPQNLSFVSIFLSMIVDAKFKVTLIDLLYDLLPLPKDCFTLRERN